MTENTSIKGLLSSGIEVQELNDTLETPKAYNVYEGGRTTPEIKDDRELVLVDEEGVDKADSMSESILSDKYIHKDRSGFGKLILPVDLALNDIPMKVGYLTSKQNFGEKEANFIGKAALGLNIGVVGSFTYDVGMELIHGEYGASDVGLPDETYLPLALGTLAVASGLKGRSMGIREEHMSEYLSNMEENVGNYSIETF